MRWVLRFLVLWSISGTLFYLFLLPWMMDRLNHKTQLQGYVQCITHLTDESLMGDLNSPITPEQGEKYCHCLSDGLILTKNDVFDITLHKPAAAFDALQKSLGETCEKDLHKAMYGDDSPSEPATLEKEQFKTEPDGLIHF